jgi:hypothetical protein
MDCSTQVPYCDLLRVHNIFINSEYSSERSLIKYLFKQVKKYFYKPQMQTKKPKNCTRVVDIRPCPWLHWMQIAIAFNWPHKLKSNSIYIERNDFNLRYSYKLVISRTHTWVIILKVEGSEETQIAKVEIILGTTEEGK